MRLTDLNDLVEDCEDHVLMHMDRMVAVCEHMADADSKTMEAMLIMARASEKAAIIDGSQGKVYILSHEPSKYYEIAKQWEAKTIREEQKAVDLLIEADEFLRMAKDYEMDIDSQMGPIYKAINDESNDMGACLRCTIL
jgi:hypothetical protein